MNIIIGILIPFFGTAIGSAMVYVFKNKIGFRLEKFLLGFASGVMIAASVWSLIIPAIDMAIQMKIISWLPAAIGFMLGIIFLLLLDYIIPHVHKEEYIDEGPKSKLSRLVKLILAVTIHNFPEGMAVGVVFAGVLAGDIPMVAALALSIGIAIQNFPEGAIISLPLRASGKSKNKAFIIGTLSGIVEPIGAVLTILLTNLIVPILPYLLSFAAGAMIYVVAEELIPNSHEGEHSNFCVIGLGVGFIIMMILDVALG